MWVWHGQDSRVYKCGFGLDRIAGNTYAGLGMDTIAGNTYVGYALTG